MIIYKPIIRTEKEIVFMPLEEKWDLINEARLYIDLLNLAELKVACFYKNNDCDLSVNHKALEAFLRMTHEYVIEHKIKNPASKIFKE